MIYDRTIRQRFWDKVDRSDIDACWPWLASTQRDGCGVSNVTISAIKTRRLWMWLP